MQRLMRSSKVLFIGCFLLMMAIHGCTLIYPITIMGRVTDAQTGNPVGGISVKVLGSHDQTCSAVTDMEGRFSIPMVATGHEFSGRTPDWTLFFESDEYQDASYKIDFASLSEDPESVDAVIVMQSLTRQDVSTSDQIP